MANKRMFNIKIVDSDAFLDMPLSTQCLYFHLNMRADDDGFIGNPKKILRIMGASEDDLKLLIAKKFVLSFEDGVIVIKHWRMHNTLSSSRYNETVYIDHKNELLLKENKSYSFENGNKFSDVKQIETGKRQVRRTKDEQKTNTDIDLDIGIGKGKDINNIPASETKKKVKHKYGEYNHVLLTDDELSKLNDEYGTSKTNEAIKYLDEAIEMKGYKYKSHYLALKKWVFDAVNKNNNEYQKKTDVHILSNGVKTSNPFVAMMEEEN